MRGNALFEPGRNCATVALTQRHAVVIDAADYFRAARDAMLRAEEQILLICWDFDPRIKLDPDADDGDHPNRLGDFILWLARRRPQLQIHVLMWRSEEHTSELQSLMRISYAVFCLKNKINPILTSTYQQTHTHHAIHT